MNSGRPQNCNKCHLLPLQALLQPTLTEEILCHIVSYLISIRSVVSTVICVGVLLVSLCYSMYSMEGQRGTVIIFFVIKAELWCHG